MTVCGIAGIWSNGMSLIERRAAVALMLGDLAVRGPDCSVIVDQDGLSLGFCRLTITGEPGMVQPIRSGPILAAVNGEIYNYGQLWDELPRDLRSTDWPTSDCALVAPLAIQYGENFVEKLDGIFAGVVADSRLGTLRLFRDQVGVKPLYYLMFHDGLAFASTVSALAPLSNQKVEPQVMARYLSDGYVAGPESLIAGIRRVPAGSVMTFEDPRGRPQTRRWFSFEEIGSPYSVRDVVARAVQSELPVAGPTVTALSGGIDSTIVTLLAAREGADPIALTVDYGIADPDLVTAKKVAKDHHLRHDLVEVSANDYLEELVGGWRFDMPLADPNAIALNRLCRRARELGSRVLLVGDGSDEVFCGYSYHLGVAGRSLRHRLAAWRFTSMTDDGDRAFAAMMSGQRIRRPFRPSFADPMRVVQRLDLENWLTPNLMEKADRFGMADQVEIRPPFLRKAVLRTGLGLPITGKVDQAEHLGKVALRTAFRDLLPVYVLDRPKQGFPCPLSSWLRGEMGQQLCADATWSVEGSWDVRLERDLWSAHIAGHRDWGQQLWRLAVARSWWQQINRPRAALEPSHFAAERAGDGWAR